MNYITYGRAKSNLYIDLLCFYFTNDNRKTDLFFRLPLSGTLKGKKKLLEITSLIVNYWRETVSVRYSYCVCTTSVKKLLNRKVTRVITFISVFKPRVSIGYPVLTSSRSLSIPSGSNKYITPILFLVKLCTALHDTLKE